MKVKTKTDVKNDINTLNHNHDVRQDYPLVHAWHCIDYSLCKLLDLQTGQLCMQ